MNNIRSSYRTLPLLAAALVATGATTAGCGNGLSTTAGSDPSVAAASPSTAPHPSTSAAGPTSSPTGTRSTSTTAPAPAAPSTRASSAGARPSSDACSEADLTIGLRDSAGGGAAGSNYVLLTFTNRRGRVCTLYGYPGVSFVGQGDGTQVGVPAVRDRRGNVRTVRLAPDHTTTALLQIVNAGNYDATRCAPTTADGLRVYPPGSKAAAFVAFTIQACQRDVGQSPQLSVSPIGTSG